MKNLRIFVILLLALVCVAIATLAACTPDPNPSDPSDPQDHTHTFAEGWTFNDTEHWHAATCEHTTERDSVASHMLDVQGKCTVCNYTVPKMTFDELVTSFKAQLCYFVATNIATKVYGDKEVLNESYFVSANSDDVLGTVGVLYTYKDGETNRITEFAKVTVNDIIENKTIADGNAMLSPEVSLKVTKVFEFDAKENFLKQDLANSLFKAAGYGDETVKLFREVESPYDNTRSFSIFIQDGSKLQVKNIEVLKDNDKDETIIQNLNNPNRYTITDDSSVTLKGENIFNEDYVLEHFEQDKEDVKITDKQVQEAIEQYCKDDLLDKLPTKSVIEDSYGSFDKSKISEEDWRVNINKNNEITRLEYSFFYTAASNDGNYVIASMTFNTPVSREDLIAGNLPKATYKEEYSLSYNPTIQENRSKLANAILTACKGAPAAEGSKVILVDNHAINDSQFGMAGRFVVVEINENGATEYQVKIKYAESDEQYIQEIANGNYYQTREPREYPISGRKLVAEQDASADKSSAPIATALPVKRKSSEFCAN